LHCFPSRQSCSGSTTQARTAVVRHCQAAQQRLSHARARRQAAQPRAGLSPAAGQPAPGPVSESSWAAGRRRRRPRTRPPRGRARRQRPRRRPPGPATTEFRCADSAAETAVGRLSSGGGGMVWNTAGNPSRTAALRVAVAGDHRTRRAGPPGRDPWGQGRARRRISLCQPPKGRSGLRRRAGPGPGRAAESAAPSPTQWAA
jgi:hypothetical protein